MFNENKEYRKSLFNRIKLNGNEPYDSLKLKIKTLNNETFWFNISLKEFNEIKKVLLNE